MADGSWQAKVHAPAAILEQIADLVGFLCEIEGENVIGVYLHGSLAMGCFRPGQSDIDLLVLIRESPPPDRIYAWAQQILQSSGAGAPLELSILAYSHYTPWRHPTPFVFHFSEEWRPALLSALNTGGRHKWPLEYAPDPDLAAHFTVAGRRGVRLAGAPISSVMPVPPWPDYLDSIRRDFGWAAERAQENPLYLALNACRIWAAVVDHLVLSKAEGAAWAVPRLPQKLQSVALAAAAEYRGDAFVASPISGPQALTVAQWIAPHLW